MKSKTITALLFATLALSALAADPPKVEVLSPSQVLVNGQPSGSIVDVLANGAPRAAVLDSVIAWEQDKTTALAAAVSTASDTIAAERAAVDKLLADKLAAELTTGDGPVAAKIRELQAAIKDARK